MKAVLPSPSPKGCSILGGLRAETGAGSEGLGARGLDGDVERLLR
jgi:hypothetical protein